MNHQLYKAAAFSLTFLTCMLQHENPVIENQEPFISANNYIITDHFFEIAPSVTGTADTLKLFTTRCDCISDTLISRFVTESYVISRKQDTLDVQLYQYTGLGAERTDTASISGRFLKVSPDTGIYGVWQLNSRLFSSNRPLLADDSIRVQNYNQGIGWLMVTPAKLSIYFYRDSIPSYTTTFQIKYTPILHKYDVHIDSISPKMLKLCGAVSRDTIVINQDSAGTIHYEITLADTSEKSVYQPNPYIYPVKDTTGTTTCQNYPDWITLFLNANPMPKDK